MNKDRAGTNINGLAGSLITGVIMVAIFGLGAVFGGAIALKKGGEVGEPTVVLFMLLAFAFMSFIEAFLMRQLSRVLGSGKREGRENLGQAPLFQPALVPASEVRAAHLRTLPEPVPSVTEHTTRTLENAFRQS